MKGNFTIGVDFGTSSVRALVLDCNSGEEMATALSSYEGWEEGRYCDPANAVFRQHPEDLINAFIEAVSSAVSMLSGPERTRIRALTIDTTGSSPTAVDSRGFPLSLLSDFRDEPDSMVILWKDNSAMSEAQEITEAASKYEPLSLLQFCGGQYSPEWYWAKILHILRTNKTVAEAASHWLEHSDWFPAMLCDIGSVHTIKRNRCGAAHKALWNAVWNGYPPSDFFNRLDPHLGTLRDALPGVTYTADDTVGRLTEFWAGKTGLPAGIPVGVGLFDAHSAAIGAGVRPGVVSKVIGTSSAEMFVTDRDRINESALAGIESLADGSIIPGLIGIEAGQPAYGDLFGWFAGMIATQVREITGDSTVSINKIIEKLSARAAERPPSSSDPIALDWINGRRAPFSNGAARTYIGPIGFGTDGPSIFATLVQGTAFGTRAIHEYLESQGLKFSETRVVGGIPQKSPFVVQILADVLDTKVGVCSTAHASARGAAIMAAVSGGLFPDTLAAIDALASPVKEVYQPDAGNAEVMSVLFQKYIELGRSTDSYFRENLQWRST